MSAVAGGTRHEFRLPDLGEGLAEAEILRWLVAPGDVVTVNQALVEVETAKAAVEIPSPDAGTVVELGAQEGELLAVGARLVVLAVAEEPGSSPTAGPPTPERSERQAVLVGYGPRESAPVRRRRRTTAVPVQPRAGRVLAKPPVRKLARDLGLDLARIPGTGPAGSVTRADVEAFRLHDAPAAPLTPLSQTPPQAATPLSPAALQEGDERIPVRSLRRATAEAMVRSIAVPQASVELAVDVSRTMQLRTRLAESARPSFLTLVARAVVLALAERPLLHARWEADSGGSGDSAEIVVPSAVSLGIAVASPRGLLVPKVRDAAGKSLRELGAAITGVTEAARAGTLGPGDLTGGTFTLSNVGVFGVAGGRSLLTPGETGILCIGAVRDRPWVEDGALVVRQVVQLTLTIDHRVVDGELAAGFLADVGELLHDPGLMLARS
jgi:pyruvate dehydrogenase E2 component (dihydrolipoamide acetyltransferase)